MFFVLIDPSHFEVNIARASVEPSWPPTSSALRARFARSKSSCSAARRTCGHCWWRFLKSLDSMHRFQGKPTKIFKKPSFLPKFYEDPADFPLANLYLQGLMVFWNNEKITPSCHVPYDSTQKNGLHQRLDECNRLFSMVGKLCLQQHPHGCWVNLSSLIVILISMTSRL